MSLIYVFIQKKNKSESLRIMSKKEHAERFFALYQVLTCYIIDLWNLSFSAEHFFSLSLRLHL